MANEAEWEVAGVAELASDVAAAVASVGLATAPLAFPRQPLAATQWSALMAEADLQRLSGLVTAAIASGALPVTAEQADAARIAHRRALAVCLLIERMLIDVAERFADQGIDFRVLKGPAFAHLRYPDPGQRPFRDLDLLVPSEQVDAAVGVLNAMGARRDVPEPRPGFDRRFGKGACLVMPVGLEVDLHRTFVPGPFGLAIDLPTLFLRTSEFVIAGRSFRALAPEEQLLHACFHAVLGRDVPRLLPLRDVVQLALVDDLDGNRVRALAGAWDCEIVVAQGLRLAWSTFRLLDETALSAWAQAVMPSRRDLRRLRSYSGASRSHAGQSFLAIAAIPGLRNKLDFACAILAPQGAAGAWGTKSYALAGLRRVLRRGVRQRREVVHRYLALRRRR